MKIAFLVNRFPCLSQTFILNQITGLIDRGHKVDIYAVYTSNDSVLHADVLKYKLLENTVYFSGRSPVGGKEENGLFNSLRSLLVIGTMLRRRPGHFMKVLSSLRHVKDEVNLSVFYNVVSLCKYRYDIIHCHFGQKGILGCSLRDLGIFTGKVVTTFHGNDISAYIKKNGKNAYSQLFHQGDLFAPISDRWKRELLDLGCSEKKITVHRMGVDTAKFAFSPGNRRNTGRIRLLTVARLVEKKGVVYGIRAFAEALGHYPDMEYTIIGDGPLRRSLEDLIAGLNLGKKIRLAGSVSQEEIIRHLKAADIFIAPSVTGENGDQEGIPVVLMEALAQGIPVLSTRHSGIGELVQDGISGFLVPERDAGALTERLRDLIDHPERWKEMGLAGRKYVEEHYDINKLNDRLVKLYEQVVAGN